MPAEKHFPTGGAFLQGFSAQLSWSHYRALMRVTDEKARLFYEQEAIECGWRLCRARKVRQSVKKQDLTPDRTGCMRAT